MYAKRNKHLCVFSLSYQSPKKEKHRQNEDKLRLGGIYQNLDFVWAGMTVGHTVRITSIKNIRKYDLPTIRLHDLRHSHTTALLLAGTNTKIVSERLGHSSTRISVEIYSHELPEMQENAADAIEQMLTKSVK